MTAIFLLLSGFLLASTTTASHYYGALMTFTYKGQNPDGTHKVECRYKEMFRSCSYSNSWSCSSGVCGSVTQLKSGRIDAASSGVSWCLSEGVMTRHISTDRPFDLRYDSCCWIQNTPASSSGNWRLLTRIDLGRRSDTSAPNRSPITAILPYLRVPQNCARSYSLLAFDPDGGDQVRCRFGLSSYSECGICNQPAGFTLNQATCSLSYSSGPSGIYSFELMLEDFPSQQISLLYSSNPSEIRTPYTSSSTKPLSKIPLQFSLQVDATAPSCTVGVYLPQFVHPTPHNGELLQASVNQELEFRVKATASSSTISSVIISGPLNITKHRNTDGEYVINWIPNENNLGEHFPICFIAEGQYGSRYYQSEMRCVIVYVNEDEVRADVTCTQTTMSVVLEKSTIPGPGHHAEHLRLNDPSCTLDSNGTHLFTNISLNDCGTVMEEDDDSLIFRNEIVSYDDPNDIITRKHEVEIEISCKYQKRNNVTVEFDAHRPAINITERGFGTFTYEFEFYDSSQFTDRKDPNSYPLEYEVGEMMYLQIESSSPVPNTEIFVESCSATPYDNPSYPLAYPIIVNGCGVDDTLKTFTSHQSDFKFGLQAFKFIGLYDQVFITCSIILCEAGNPNTRCSEGCSNTTAAFSVPHRHRRDAPIQTGNHYISQGPLRLRRSTGRSEVSGTQKLDLNLVFVAGCLLAAVGMVCGVMVIRTRRSEIKYQPLSSSEF